MVWERRMREGRETNRILPIKKIDNNKHMVYITKQTEIHMD